MNIELTDTDLVIRLSPLEKIAAFAGDRRVALSEISRASVDPDPMRSIRGRMLMGLRVPRRYYMARSGFGREFWALTGRRPALRVDLRDGRRVTATATDPESMARRITGKLARGA